MRPPAVSQGATMKLTSDEIDIPATSVSVYDAIFRRRNVKAFTDDPVSREVLERLFAAAIWAPNHRLTEPTRIFAIPRESAMRQRLGDIAWQAAYDGVANPDPVQKRRAADDSRDRVVTAPAMVYVYSLPGATDEMTRELRYLLLRRSEHGPRRRRRGSLPRLEHRAPDATPRPGAAPGCGRGMDDGGGRLPRAARGVPDSATYTAPGRRQLAGVTAPRPTSHTT